MNSFNKKVAELTRAMNSADAYRSDLSSKLPLLKQAVIDAASVPNDTYEQVLAIEKKLNSINIKLNGDALRAKYEGAAPYSLKGRIEYIAGSLWSTTSAPTTTFQQNYDIAAGQFSGILTELQQVSNDVQKVESVLEKYGAPYTPGRLPVWKQ